MKKHIVAVVLLFFAGTVLFGQGNWQHMGPFKNSVSGNVFKTGRADCIALHPLFDNVTNKTVYLGSFSGGLWKTTDGGLNWSNLNDGSPLKYNGVSALAIEPGASGAVYVADISKYNSAAATLVGSGGIYKYFPASGSWLSTGPLPGVTQPLLIKHIKIHPANSAYIYACTNQGIFRSVNSGTSWSLVASGAYENVGFMPRTGGSGTYPYYIYASGQQLFTVSSDDGSTFSAVSCMTSYLTQYQTGYANMAYTASTLNPGEFYVYLFVAHSDTANIPVNYRYFAYATSKRAYALYRYTYNSITGLESCAELLKYFDHDSNDDRMSLDANDEVAYFGGVSLFKYNADYPARMYYPNSASPESYINSGGTFGYSVNGIHADQHDVILRPALNMFFVANDGGFYQSAYTPYNTPDNGVYTNTWSEKNTGLHISQVWGFSGAEEDPDFFMTSEADNCGFFSSTLTTTYQTYGGENPGALIDKYDSDQLFYRNYSGNSYIQHSSNRGVSADASQNYWEYPSATDECDLTQFTAFTMPSSFTINTLFQDPNRPGQFYYGTGDHINHWCASNKLFSAKFSYYGIYRAATIPTDSLHWSTWGMTAKSMAFSKANKNKVYFCTTGGFYDPTPGAENAAPQVYAFTGSDIDDSWSGHNDTQWQPITPNFFSASVLPTPLPNIATAALVQYAGVAASDWNPDRVWLAFTTLPLNPQVKVMKYEGGVWTDYSTGIAPDEVPVSIVYEQGSNDQLYLGTNRSMYYRSAGMAYWALYDNGLPHVSNVQMQVNYKENTVRTGTYGRGVWKSSLKCPDRYDTTATGTISANKFVEMEHAITGQNLTISNGDVKFRAGAYVDLLPDFLVTANATTTFFAYIHACNTPGNTFRRPDDENGEDWITDAEEVKEQFTIEIFPNPSSGRFMVRKEETDAAKIEVYNTMGQQVYAGVFADGETELDLSAQPNGVYLVRIIGGDRMQTRRIIKQ